MFSLILNFARFNVGSFVEGRQAPNIRVYGKIVDIMGEGRHKKFQVHFINGNTAELAASSLWSRTERLECFHFNDLEADRPELIYLD